MMGHGIRPAAGDKETALASGPRRGRALPPLPVWVQARLGQSEPARDPQAPGVLAS